MVFADPTARTINRPSDGTDRTVANNFGVFAPLSIRAYKRAS